MNRQVVFMLSDMYSEKNAFFVMCASYFADNGDTVTVITHDKPKKEDYRYSPKIRRLCLNAPVKGRYIPEQVLDYYVKFIPESYFILNGFDGYINRINIKHKVIKFLPSNFINPLSNEAVAKIQIKQLYDELDSLQVIVNNGKIKPVNNRLGMLKKVKGKIRHCEEKRYLKYRYIQLSDEEVERSREAAVGMFKEVKRICEKHNLRYYLAAGSLLGVIRHGGQIPWDDDVDVTMPRPDYEKFLKLAKKELAPEYILPSNNFPYGFHRIQVKGTNIERFVRQKKPHGIFMDILPLDGAAPESERVTHSYENKRLTELMYEMSYPMPIFNFDENGLKKWLKRFFIKCFYSKSLLMKKWYKNATKYSTEKADEWVCLSGAYGYEKECFPKEYWDYGVTGEFEGEECSIMAEWEKYLSLHYGDYMEKPPELLRRTHPLFSIDFGD